MEKPARATDWASLGRKGGREREGRREREEGRGRERERERERDAMLDDFKGLSRSERGNAFCAVLFEMLHAT